MPSAKSASGVLRFLRRLDAEFPGDVPLHLIMDNYGTHKHEKVTAWLKRHPGFVSHFVPSSSSWINLVERWLSHLDNKAIERGVFLGVEDLQASIAAFLSQPETSKTQEENCIVIPRTLRYIGDNVAV